MRLSLAETAVAAYKLQHLARRVRMRGFEDIARELYAISQLLLPAGRADSGDLLSVEDTACLLGLHSSEIVTQWIDGGLLEVFTYMGQPLITRRSVQRFASSSFVMDQRAFEASLEFNLDVVDSLVSTAPAAEQSA